ncbi:MAG: FtsW/RodA/SpoVE family cell cycle protein [Candidatus Paceibacterota bacterium]|jgi:rod shape determining protein RodA
MELIKRLKGLDWMLITCALALSVFGLVSIYSSSLADGNFSNFQKQIFFLFLGLGLMFFFSFFDWRIFKNNSYLILILYFVCLLLLVGLFFFAPEIRGVKSWYRIAIFSIDPIELTKIVLIILLAKYFSTRHVEIYQIRHILLSGFYVLVPVILVFLQPDFGSVLILIALWVGVLIVSGIKLRHFLLLLFCGILILTVAWMFLMKDYQKDRILSFISPDDPLGSGWSQNQARIAVGSGGLFGQGIGAGSQTQYGFLPEAHTDFIFAAIAEETGLAGVFILFVSFAVLFWRVAKIIFDSESNFPRLFAMGFSVVLLFQIFIHVGMNLGISPIIGISLPFVSYGGSGLIASFAGLGIILNMKNNR